MDSQTKPISVGLLSKTSLTGGLVVLGVALFFIVALPWINQLVPGDNPFRVGEPYVVAGSYQITPEPGWEIASENELLTTITKSGASFVLLPPTEADGETLEGQINLTVQALENDASTTWVIGDPQTFVTGAGDHGLQVVAHSHDQASETWVIEHEEWQVTLVAQSPDSVWKSLSAELEAMASSVVFIAEDDE